MTDIIPNIDYEDTDAPLEDCGAIPEEVIIFRTSVMKDTIAETLKNPLQMRLFGDHWFTGEIHFLFADSNIGKSILALQMANDIARGESSIEGMVVDTPPQKVLYFDFEMSSQQVARRYNNPDMLSDNLLRGTVDEDADFELVELCGFDNMERILKETGIKVLIIDNITFFSYNIQDAETAAPIIQRLTRIKRKYGCSILVVAHTPKIEEMQPISRSNMGGSKMLMNFCDSATGIGRTRDGKRYIKLVKTRMVAEPTSETPLKYFSIEGDGYLHFEYQGEETEQRLLFSKQQNDFFQNIFGSDTHLELNTLVKRITATGITEKNARKRIDRAVKSNTLHKDNLIITLQ